jgi:quinoprotein dehydrogenase-associated probable ABC transporter substrate-binding protein
MSSGSSRRTAILVYAALALVVLACTVIAVALERRTASHPDVVHLVVPPADDADVPRPDPTLLRVCADPNDLPYSNHAGEGFENAIAELVAADLHKTLRYVWQPQRRGFIRSTLGAGLCDLVIGVPEDFELARTTKPYYRSTYVFVARKGGHRAVSSLDDRALRTMRIGVQIVGEDYDNPPPVQALAARGLADCVRGYTVYGNYADAAPQRALVDAVARGDVDVAIAWGPLAGYFATRSSTPLVLTPVPAVQDRATPFTFGIAMGVRRDAAALARTLNETIDRHRADIRQILERFGVPLVG